LAPAPDFFIFLVIRSVYPKDSRTDSGAISHGALLATKVMGDIKGNMKKCPICQSSASFALTKDGCPYSQCDQCEFLFYRPERDDAATSSRDFYDHGYWEMERAEALRREKEDGFIRALELLYLSPIRVETVLDFGCGLGVTVQMLREKLGLDAIGVDLSADFVETEYLHRCDLQTLAAKYPPGHFDAVYSIEVFEHLDDPGSILSLLNGLVKPEGKLLINTGTREFLAKYDPELAYIDPLRRGHISIYSLKCFALLASMIGRKVEFLGARKYELILSPAAGQLSYPHAENLERFRRLGEWYPAFLSEYLRLVDVEREFESRSAWALQLLKEADELRAKIQALSEKLDAPRKPF